MIDESGSERSDLDDVLDRAWGVVRDIIDSAAKAQRAFLRIRPRLVRIDKVTMESITAWAAEFLFPQDELWEGEWESDDEVVTPSED